MESLAIEASNDEIRNRARQLLKTPAYRTVRKNLNRLNCRDRQFILLEIEKWEADGLLEPERADIIKQRYNFDSAPLAQPKPVAGNCQSFPVIESPASFASVPPAPATPAQPRPSLMQTLLSELSIKVYLYLGAFFVIASALILAAVVEATRLPILVAATSAFGGGAFIIRKRLPQPSFALFIVFSFLLPIDANVLEETIHFHEPALSTYWTFVFLLMALIWSFSIWFYASRFFSLVAFVAMTFTFHRAAQIFQTETELQILFGMFASLAGLTGISLLKKWREDKFALPVFLLAQLQAIGLLLVSLTLAVIHVFDSDIASGWWLVIALTWIAASSFFAAGDILFPFFLFPWMAVAALLPLPWFFLNALHSLQPVYSIGFWIWGTIFALLSEVTFRLEKIQKYGWALLAGSAPLFLTSIIVAFDWDKPLLTFTLIAGTALVYAALHVLRPRWYVWSAALLGALSAYFVFFTLPMIDGLNISFVYQILGASILLTIPELFARTPLTLQNPSRLPTLALGLLVSVMCIASAFIDMDHSGQATVVFLTFAILFTLHAFHFNRTWIGYFAISAEVLAILFALQYFERDLWLPALTLMSVLYYGTGFLLRRFDSDFKAWGPVLINSGLVLGALLSFTALFMEKETAGWYMIPIALLFAAGGFCASPRLAGSCS